MERTLNEMKQKTWTELITHVNMLVFLVFLVEVAFMIQNILMGTMQRSLGDYAFRFIVIPTVWNIIMCVVLRCVSTSKELSEDTKQYIMVSAMLGICTIVAVVHSYFAPMQCVFAAVIICSALIGTRSLITFTYLMSLVGLACTVPLSRFFNQFTSLGLQIESTVVSAVLLLMVAVLSNAILSDKQRSIVVLKEYAEDLEKAMHEARTDSMTGLYNHTEFYNVLQLARIDLEKIAVAILDIDHFKLVNDTYGHESGDKVIIEIASICRSITNSKDIYSFRYGGEEFAFIFFNTDIDMAYYHVKNVIRQVKSLRFDFNGGKTITMSAGIFGCNPSGYSAEDIFVKADTALYYSKEHGRDQINVYKEGMDSES